MKNNPLFYSKAFLEQLLTTMNRAQACHMIAHLKHQWNLPTPMAEALRPLERMLEGMELPARRLALIYVLENHKELQAKGKAIERAEILAQGHNLPSQVWEMARTLNIAHEFRIGAMKFYEQEDVPAPAGDWEPINKIDRYLSENIVRKTESFSDLTRRRLMYLLLKSQVPIATDPKVEDEHMLQAVALFNQGWPTIIKNQLQKALEITSPHVYAEITEYYRKDSVYPRTGGNEIWALARLVRRHYFPASPSTMSPKNRRIYKHLMAMILDSMKVIPAAPKTWAWDEGVDKGTVVVTDAVKPGMVQMDIESYSDSNWKSQYFGSWDAADIKPKPKTADVIRDRMEAMLRREQRGEDRIFNWQREMARHIYNTTIPQRFMIHAPRHAGKTNLLHDMLVQADLASIEKRMIGSRPELAMGYAVHDAFNNLLKPQEKFTMKITTQTLVNGVDIKNISQDKLFELIAGAEAEIKRLGEISNKPASLKMKIEELESGIKQLVAFMDAA